ADGEPARRREAVRPHEGRARAPLRLPVGRQLRDAAVRLHRSRRLLTVAAIDRSGARPAARDLLDAEEAGAERHQRTEAADLPVDLRLVKEADRVALLDGMLL